MVIVLLDGEEIEGTIEWYDRGALKVNRKVLQSARAQTEHQVHLQG